MGGQPDRRFETRFVWDHGGEDIYLCIFNTNQNITLPMHRNTEGYFEVKTELGQGRFEYCFSVDGKWTHDPDLPALRNQFGHFSNMIKIVDPQRVIESKVARSANIVRTGSATYSTPLEKCFSNSQIQDHKNGHVQQDRFNQDNTNEDLVLNEDDDCITDDDDVPDLDDPIPDYRIQQENIINPIHASLAIQAPSEINASKNTSKLNEYSVNEPKDKVKSNSVTTKSTSIATGNNEPNSLEVSVSNPSFDTDSLQHIQNNLPVNLINTETQMPTSNSSESNLTLAESKAFKHDPETSIISATTSKDTNSSFGTSTSTTNTQVASVQVGSGVFSSPATTMSKAGVVETSTEKTPVVMLSTVTSNSNASDILDTNTSAASNYEPFTPTNISLETKNSVITTSEAIIVSTSLVDDVLSPKVSFSTVSTDIINTSSTDAATATVATSLVVSTPLAPTHLFSTLADSSHTNTTVATTPVASTPEMCTLLTNTIEVTSPKTTRSFINPPATNTTFTTPVDTTSAANTTPAPTTFAAATPADTNPVVTYPAATTPVDSTTVDSTSAATTPAATNSVVTTPAATTLTATTPVPFTPAATTPVDNTLTATTPVDSTPAATTPAATNPVATTPAATAPVNTTPAATTPAATTPAATTPAAITPLPFTPAATTPAESTPAAIIPVDNTHAATTHVATTLADSTPVDTTPVDTTPVVTTSVYTTPSASNPVDTAPAATTSEATTVVATTVVATTPAAITSAATTPAASTPAATTPVPFTPVPITPTTTTPADTTPVATTPVATTPVDTTSEATTVVAANHKVNPVDTTPVAITSAAISPVATSLAKNPGATTPVASAPVATTHVATTPVATTSEATTPVASPPTATIHAATSLGTVGTSLAVSTFTPAETPSVTIPAANTSAATTPSATTPSATTSTLSASTPVATTPAATTPEATLPAVSTPSAITLAATTPAGTTPVDTTPAASNSVATAHAATTSKAATVVAANPKATDPADTRSGATNLIAITPAATSPLATSLANNPGATSPVATTPVVTSHVASTSAATTPAATNPPATNPVATTPVATTPAASPSTATIHAATSLGTVGTSPTETTTSPTIPAATTHAATTPAATTPATTTPADTIPAATTPVATTPAASSPASNTSAPTTPSVTTHAATTPSATTSSATTPEATTSTPSAAIPVETTPAATFPAVSTSSATTPAATTPAATTPAAPTPKSTDLASNTTVFTTPTETTPVVIYPSVTTSEAPFPAANNPVDHTPRATSLVETTPAATIPVAATSAAPTPVATPPAATNLAASAPVATPPAAPNSADATPLATYPAATNPAATFKEATSLTATNPAATTHEAPPPTVSNSAATYPAATIPTSTTPLAATSAASAMEITATSLVNTTELLFPVLPIEPANITKNIADTKTSIIICVNPETSKISVDDTETVNKGCVDPEAMNISCLIPEPVSGSIPEVTESSRSQAVEGENLNTKDMNFIKRIFGFGEKSSPEVSNNNESLSIETNLPNLVNQTTSNDTNKDPNENIDSDKSPKLTNTESNNAENVNDVIIREKTSEQKKESNCMHERVAKPDLNSSLDNIQQSHEVIEVTDELSLIENESKQGICEFTDEKIPKTSSNSTEEKNIICHPTDTPSKNQAEEGNITNTETTENLKSVNTNITLLEQNNPEIAEEVSLILNAGSVNKDIPEFAESKNVLNFSLKKGDIETSKDDENKLSNVVNANSECSENSFTTEDSDDEFSTDILEKDNPKDKREFPTEGFKENDTNSKLLSEQKAVESNHGIQINITNHDNQGSDLIVKPKETDLFSQIKTTFVSIERSRSRSELRLRLDTDLQKSSSRSKLFESASKGKDGKVGFPHRESRPKSPIETILSDEETDQITVMSPRVKRKMQEQERGSTVMKLDAIFAPMRSESVDDMRTSIRIRGMGDVNLKPQVIQKRGFDHNKMDQAIEQKRIQQKLISMPDKPAKYKKPKPKLPPKEPSPPPQKELIPVHEPSLPQKESSPIPTKEPTPEPPTFEVLMPKIVTKEENRSSHLVIPTTPAKIGINGFDRMGRLILRSAIEAGYDIAAVNDPFIPLHYMVHALKFDISNTPWKGKRKDLNIQEGPLGNLIINGKTIEVFTERDPKKIPWEMVEASIVIETNEALNTFNDAKLHLREIPEVCEETTEKGGSHYTGVQKVLIAFPSPDAKCLTLGVSKIPESLTSKIISHTSAAVSALAIVLKVLDDKFGIQFCSFTLLKAVMGGNRDIKCPVLGPNNHTRSVKFDFKETLVPVQPLEVQEGVFRVLPNMRGRMTGLLVYTPVPQVSMLDLTVSTQTQSQDIYRDVCKEMKARAESSHKGIINYVPKMSTENSASCLFAGTTSTVVFDDKSGVQVSDNCVKLVLWFDNESSFASRIIDIVKAYQKPPSPLNRV